MRLAHFDFENFFVFDGRINVLVIEHGKYFRKYSSEIITQIEGNEGNFVLSKNEKQLLLSANATVVYDYFNLSLSDKKLLNKLYSVLSNIIQDNFSGEYATLLEAFEGLFQKLNAEYDIPLDSEETTIQTLLKAFGVKFNSEQSFLENLISYVEIFRTLNKIKLFCFINLKSFLSNEELLLFYDYAVKNELNLFLLECKHSQSLPNEFVTLIDEDLCEIRLE